MNIWKGKALCEGIAIGKARVYRKKTDVVKKYIEDYKAESEKFATVKSLAIDELDADFFYTQDDA